MYTSPPVVLQKANWRDIQDLYRMERVCFDKDAWPVLDILGVLTFPGVVRIKAVAENTMAGFIGGDRREHNTLGWIITLGVLPQYRRQGIASELIEACEQELETPIVRLSVRKSNYQAIALYKKFNYTQIEIWPQYYQGGEDALVLEKKFR